MPVLHHSDIKFFVGEERQLICAHKCLLAARCEVFRAMFAVQKTEEQPAPLMLTDIKPRIFLAMLEFIYGNCCSLTPECVVDIMAASIEYGLDGLTKVKLSRLCWEIMIGMFLYYSSVLGTCEMLSISTLCVNIYR